MWCSWVVSLGDGGVDKPTPDWPNCVQSPEGLMAVVAATCNSGGGGERKDGMVMTCDIHDVLTMVAQFGNLQVPIIN